MLCRLASGYQFLSYLWVLQKSPRKKFFYSVPKLWERALISLPGKTLKRGVLFKIEDKEWDGKSELLKILLSQSQQGTFHNWSCWSQKLLYRWAVSVSCFSNPTNVFILCAHSQVCINALYYNEDIFIFLQSILINPVSFQVS